MALLAVLVLLLFQAADLSAVRHADPVPRELAAPVATAIAPGGVKVAVGGNTLTFWWVNRLLPSAKATAGKPPASWADVDEGSLVGAVKVERDFRDVRGRVIRAGTYTLRYGLQPKTSDHLGVSPHRDFLLLSPIAFDKDPEPRGHDGTIELSKETIGGSHPAVLSIDPPSATAAPLSIATTALGHKGIVFEVPTATGTFRFGLVLIGKIEA